MDTWRFCCAVELNFGWQEFTQGQAHRKWSKTQLLMFSALQGDTGILPPNRSYSPRPSAQASWGSYWAQSSSSLSELPVNKLGMESSSGAASGKPGRNPGPGMSEPNACGLARAWRVSATTVSSSPGAGPHWGVTAPGFRARGELKRQPLQPPAECLCPP